MPRVDGTNLRKVMSEQVNMAGSVLWTDEGTWYNQIGKEFQAHETVNHSADEYVDWITGASTNKPESYFSQLKRSLDGTHHRVSRSSTFPDTYRVRFPAVDKCMKTEARGCAIVRQVRGAQAELQADKRRPIVTILGFGSKSLTGADTLEFCD